MKKIYETPEANVVCFQSLNSFALLEHDVQPANEGTNPGVSGGVGTGGKDEW